VQILGSCQRTDKEPLVPVRWGFLFLGPQKTFIPLTRSKEFFPRRDRTNSCSSEQNFLVAPARGGHGGSDASAASNLGGQGKRRYGSLSLVWKSSCRDIVLVLAWYLRWSAAGREFPRAPRQVFLAWRWKERCFALATWLCLVSEPSERRIYLGPIGDFFTRTRKKKLQAWEERRNKRTCPVGQAQSAP
jgi:hypothetical protein